jgi:two-component system response regulator HydG
MVRKRILVVDDEPLMREFISETLRRRKYDVKVAKDGLEALNELESWTADLVISDIKMPKMNGMELLERVGRTYPSTDVIMITAYGTVDDAVKAIKRGACDYIQKPFTAEELAIKVSKALEFRGLTEENRYLRQELGGKYSFEQIVGASPKMLKVFEAMDMVIGSKATVLIQGESGTGKELVARAIHLNGPRKNGPFIKINCAAMPETLMESELFGHEKGAFTGAIRTTDGRFIQAHGGTLLLDEISEMSHQMQAKLLRVLQEREFERVGGKDTIKVDIRIIATTNRDLKEAIKKEEFREDLYYRLNVFPINLPKLVERRSDIPLLVDHYVKKFSREYERDIRGVQDVAMDQLMRYHWPGNVRELENKLERAVILCNDTVIGTKQLFIEEQELFSPPPPIVEVGATTLKEMEKAMIVKTLRENDNNRTRTADILGISIRTLRNKLREYRGEGQNLSSASTA